ncbi:MAG: beta-propeller domain-containing protein [Micromonosporaceae bacterium]
MRNTTRGAAATLASGLAITIGLAGCTAADPYEDTTTPTGRTPQLVAFDSCGTALKELKSASRRYVGPYGFQFGSADAADGRANAEAGAEREAAAPAAPGAGADQSAPEYSGTNTHEAGVDEPDLVKTDGRRIVTVADGVLRVVDVAARSQTGTLQLTDVEYGEGPAPVAAQLLMHGDRVLVVLADQHIAYDRGGPAVASPTREVFGPELLLVDISAAPRVVSRMKLDGQYVDARAVGGTVRLVTRSVPRVPFEHPDGKKSEARAERDNRVSLERSTISDWLPRYEIDDGRTVTRGQVGCDAVSRPTAYTGTSMLTVTTLGLEASALSGAQSVSIVADGSTVYGTGKTLYVASDQRMVRALGDGTERRGAAKPAQPRTDFYKFDTSRAGAPRFTGAGTVPGWLINQYAMSEHDGYLRVATTTGDMRGGGNPEQEPKSQSAVYVLAHQGKRLHTVGRVGGLGKGERIYAVRFAGPVGYVVTFRQTDPLYTVDLTDPRKPTVAGELKITGYSAYLHPAAAGRLIGVGQEANERGQTQGTQVSLFDVSELSAPRRLAQYHLKFANSEAEYDPHAFLYWPKTGLLVIPVTGHLAEPAGDRPEGAYGGALVLKLSGDNFTELGTIGHPSQGYGGVRRTLFIDGTLWTVSQAGLMASDATTLKQQAWISFS